MFKRLYIIVSALVALAGPLSAQDTLFPYPKVPDNIVDFTDRTDYYVTHFWDECRLKSEFSSRQRFAEAFNDYATMLPHATADVALESVSNLIAKVSKSSPKDILTLGEIAEEAFYDGKIGFTSDVLYLPFARAVAGAKKVSSADKARFVQQARVLGNSQEGNVAPDFKFTAIDGSKHSFNERHKSYTLLFVNDPDCDECRMARVRLAADYYIKQYVSTGQLQIYSIYPGDYSKQWAADAEASAGDNWTLGACPTLDDIYDLRTSPTLYYLDRNGKILSKTSDVDMLLQGFYKVYMRQQQQQQ